MAHVGLQGRHALVEVSQWGEERCVRGRRGDLEGFLEARVLCLQVGGCVAGDGGGFVV